MRLKIDTLDIVFTCTRPALSIGLLLLGLGCSISEEKNGGGLEEGWGWLGNGFAAM